LGELQIFDLVAYVAEEVAVLDSLGCIPCVLSASTDDIIIEAERSF